MPWKSPTPSLLVLGFSLIGIDRVIGQGGFGIVYQATHVEMDTVVAIKEYFPSELAFRLDQAIRPSKSEYESQFVDVLRRFVEEAKRLEFLRDCPSVVTCRDLFRGNGTAYMVMDYVEGLPLSKLLKERENNEAPFDEKDLLGVIKPLVTGLQVVHDAGVYHRDIKPSNILIRNADSHPVFDRLWCCETRNRWTHEVHGTVYGRLCGL